jgi:hypothetical protein
MHDLPSCQPARLSPVSDKRGTRSDGLRPPEQPRFDVERFEKLVREGLRDGLIETTLRDIHAGMSADLPLAFEIGMLRLELLRLVVEDSLRDDPHQRTLALTRLADSLVRALRARQELAIGAVDPFRAAVERAFINNGGLREAR